MPVGRSLRRRHAGGDLRIAVGPLPSVVEREGNGQVLRRRVEQLAAQADVIQGVRVLLQLRVVESAVALRS